MTLPRPPIHLLPSLLVACGDSADDADAGRPGQANYVIGGGSCSYGGGAAGDGAGTCQILELTSELPSSNLEPTGTGTVMFEGREYRPDSAIRELSDAPDPLDPAPGPRRDVLLIHDGETRVFRSFEGEPSLPDGPVDTIEYGVFDATVAVSITLLRPASEIDPSGRVHVLSPGAGDDDGQGLVADADIVQSALFVDLDGDGVASTRAEVTYPTSGQLVRSGTEAFPSLTFDFVFEEGQAIEGGYEGGYEPIELVPETGNSAR